MSFFELLSTNTTVLVTTAVVLGLLVGSFLNVVIFRLPIMMERDWKAQCYEYLELNHPDKESQTTTEEQQTFNLLKPDSHCPSCNHKITALENIPVISYVFLRGKCSQCNTPISIRYPSIELFTAVCSGLVAYNFGATWLTLALLLFCWALIVLTLIDFDHQLLPDNITLPLLWLGLLVNAAGVGLGVSLQDAVYGVIVGYLVLWSFYWIFKLLTGKDGMGYGDFKLLAAIGAWMGIQSILPIIILSSLIGAITGILTIVVFKRDKSAPIPFGPFLACAGFVMLVWGPQLTNLYTELVF